MNDLACPICGNTQAERRAEFSFWDRRWEVAACSGCGLCRLEHRWQAEELERFYQEDRHGVAAAAEAYTEIRAERPLYLERFDRRLREIERLVRPGRILDIGSSVGHFLEAARARGWDPIGLELSTYAATVAQAAGWSVVTRPLEAAGLPMGSLRAVTMWHVLEHLPDPVAALRAARALLEHGGVVGIEVPNFGGRMAQRHSRRWGHFRPWHLWYFTGETLARTLEVAGFEQAGTLADGGSGLGSALRRHGGGWVRVSIWLGNLAARVRPVLTLARAVARGVGRGDENLVMYGRNP